MDWQLVGAQLAPILTLFFGLGTLAAVFIIVQQRRTARITNFGFVREQSELRARRLVIIMLVLAILAAVSGTLWGVSRQSPELLPTAEPTVTTTAIPSPTPRTPTATAMSTATPTMTPTPTVTPLPPDDELPSVFLTPFPPGAIEPGEDAALVELVLASGEQNSSPLNPGTSFPVGIGQVYAFFTFDGMARNVPWSHVWYIEVDGEMIEYWSSLELWAYGTRGTNWRYILTRPGKYELDIYVGRSLQQKIPFVVEAAE